MTRSSSNLRSGRNLVTRIALLALLVLLGAGGCASMAHPDQGDLPWTGRESWELAPNLPGNMFQQ